MFIILIIIGIVAFLVGIIISIRPDILDKYFNLSAHLSETEMTYIGYVIGIIGLILVLISTSRF